MDAIPQSIVTSANPVHRRQFQFAKLSICAALLGSDCCEMQYLCNCRAFEWESVLSLTGGVI